MQPQQARKPVGFGTIVMIVLGILALAYLYTVRPVEYRSMSELREIHYDSWVLHVLPFNIMTVLAILLVAFGLYRLFARPQRAPQPYPYPQYQAHAAEAASQALHAAHMAAPLASSGTAVSAPPVAQPAAPSSAHPQPLQVDYPRYDNRLLAKVLAYALNGYALMIMLIIAYAFREKEGGERVTFLNFVHDSAEMNVLLGTPLLVMALLFLAWKYRATATLFNLAGTQSVTPAGAVYWYFVPLAWFWKPYEAMRNIFAGFGAGRNGHFILPLWWGLWWLSVLAPVAFHLAMPDGYRPTLPVLLTFFALDALSCVATAQLVTQVATAQEIAIRSWSNKQDHPDTQPKSSA